MRGRCGAIPHVNVYNIYMAVAIAFVKRGGAGRSEAFRAALGPIRPGAKRASLHKPLGQPGPQRCRCCGAGSSPLSSHHRSPCAARTPAAGRWQAQPRPCQRARAEPAPDTCRKGQRRYPRRVPDRASLRQPSPPPKPGLDPHAAAAMHFRTTAPQRSSAASSGRGRCGLQAKRLVGPHAIGIACRKASAPGCRVGRNRPATCSGVAR